VFEAFPLPTPKRSPLFPHDLSGPHFVTFSVKSFVPEPARDQSTFPFTLILPRSRPEIFPNQTTFFTCIIFPAY
jgi:hypothetical protein